MQIEDLRPVRRDQRMIEKERRDREERAVCLWLQGKTPKAIGEIIGRLDKLKNTDAPLRQGRVVQLIWHWLGRHNALIWGDEEKPATVATILLASRGAAALVLASRLAAMRFRVRHAELLREMQWASGREEALKGFIHEPRTRT